jgi:hypothetical protein
MDKTQEANGKIITGLITIDFIWDNCLEDKKSGINVFRTNVFRTNVLRKNVFRTKVFRTKTLGQRSLGQKLLDKGL